MIDIPATATTNATDQAIAMNASLKDMTALARNMEAKYERLKLINDNLLSAAYQAPLVAAGDISDADLEQIIRDAGWVFAKESFGTSEEWQMWTNRFRRFRAAVIAAQGRR